MQANRVQRGSTAPRLAARLGMGALALAGLAAALVWLAALRAASPAQAGPPTYAVIQTYPNPAPNADEEFGSSVRWLEATGQVVVGAPGDRLNGADPVGAVYVLAGDTGAVDLVLHKPVTFSGDLFGSAVAVAVTEVVVGAPNDDSAGGNNGAVYQFDAGNGTLVYSYTEEVVTTQDRFGRAVAIISGTIVVGAPQYDSPASDAGRVYLCSLITGTCPDALGSPATGSGANFGGAVATVGDHVAIGAPFDGSHGTVFIYAFDGMTATLAYTIAQTLSPSGDEFGRALAAVDNRVLIGAPSHNLGANDAGAAFLYELDGTLVHTFTNPIPHANDRFGSALAANDSLIAIGAPDDDDAGPDDAGAVHLFDANTFAFMGTVYAPTPTTEARFGLSLAGAGDEFLAGSLDTVGGRVFAGAVHRIGVYVQTDWRIWLPLIMR
jgi:hypothetical protein